MFPRLMIDRTPQGNRFALLEEGRVVEFFCQGAGQRDVGDILLGRVIQVQPGLDAAFVDIGDQRNAFLPLHEPPAPLPKVGDTLMVQIKRLPGGEKGVRLTQKVAISGSLLALLGQEPKFCGISQKITEPAQRERLRDILGRACPEGVGWILRTSVCEIPEGEQECRLSGEAEKLFLEWKALQQRAEYERPPALLRGQDPSWKWVEGLLQRGEVRAVWVSEESLREEIERRLREIPADVRPEVRVEAAGLSLVEDALRKALARKVWLKNGGSLIFDRCEALTVIDVNSGKFEGGKDVEDTALRINLEACAEIARQLRLRDIGGIVVVDFIDMAGKAGRKAVMEAMAEAVLADPGRPHLVDLSELCLLQLTRKSVHGARDGWTANGFSNTIEGKPFP